MIFESFLYIIITLFTMATQNYECSIATSLFFIVLYMIRGRLDNDD